MFNSAAQASPASPQPRKSRGKRGQNILSESQREFFRFEQLVPVVADQSFADDDSKPFSFRGASVIFAFTTKGGTNDGGVVFKVKP
jgi:hypothetical protein